MTRLSISGLSKSFSPRGKPLPVLSAIDLDVDEGTFLTIVGASGCCKSTLLKAIAGLFPAEGWLEHDGCPAAMNTIEGMRSTSPELIEVGRALRFTRLQFARRVFLPAAAPSIMTGVHLALIYSWLATVAAEYLMTVGPGIGSMIVGGHERFDMEVVMHGVGILGAVGFFMNPAAAHVEARALRWRSLR